MNNEPAFPCRGHQDPHGFMHEKQSGMTLRDYFAVHATDADIAPYLLDYDNLEYRPAFTNSMTSMPARQVPKDRPVAVARYMFADKMMEARDE